MRARLYRWVRMHGRLAASAYAMMMRSPHQGFQRKKTGAAEMANQWQSSPRRVSRRNRCRYSGSVLASVPLAKPPANQRPPSGSRSFHLLMAKNRSYNRALLSHALGGTHRNHVAGMRVNAHASESCSNGQPPTFRTTIQAVGSSIGTDGPPFPCHLGARAQHRQREHDKVEDQRHGIEECGVPAERPDPA